MSSKCDCGAEFHEEPAHKLSCASLSPAAEARGGAPLQGAAHPAGMATARPWMLGSKLDEFTDLNGAHAVPVWNESGLLVVCDAYGTDDECARANAALIVAAVNEREGLIAKLREMEGA